MENLIKAIICLIAFATVTIAGSKSKILVVGGAGYIGSTTAMALKDAGYEVHILDDLSTGHKELVQPDVGLTISRAGNAVEVAQLLSREKYSAVMYFAAKSQVGESVRLPEVYWENNVEQTKLFLKMMLDAGTKTFIFSSTAATYGNPEAEFINEKHPQNPINPYGETKLAVEKHLVKLASEQGLRAITLRYFNASGAEADSRVGEWHDPETHLIPLVLKAIRSGKPIKVFGTDYPTEDGTAIRDYIHVTDLAKAHIQAMQWLQTKSGSVGIFEAFNLGSKSGFSVRQVIEAAERVTGKKVPYEESPRREGDPARLVADSTKARVVLGFKTEAAGAGSTEEKYLENIIQTAWVWEHSLACRRFYFK